MAAAEHDPTRPAPQPAASRRTCPEPVTSPVEGRSRRAVLAAALAAPLAAPLLPAALADAATPNGRSSSSRPVTFKDRAAAAQAPPPQPAPHPDRSTPSIGSAWDRALARFRKANAAIEAASGTEDDDLYDRLGARHDRALERLLTAPAPDAAALADKLDLLVHHQAWELGFADAALASIRRDARRFGGRID